MAQRTVPPLAETPFLRVMRRLSPTVQRIILAFTTGLFLACAAQVSGQGQGFTLSAPAAP